MRIELYYPTKPYRVNQPFGANWNPSYKQKGLKGHSGEDLFTKHGQPVYASHDGICFPTVDDHGGNGIVLQAEPLYKAYFTIYWHLMDADAVVHTGQKVKAGDLIAYADNTGNSTGDHLHFGLTDYTNYDPNNGYEGHLDPQLYYNGKYAEDINKVEETKPKFVFTKVLRLKSFNNDVKQLQLILQKQNLYTGAIDGVFGPKTQQGVKDFQIKYKLYVDGVVGAKTNTILNTL